MKSLLTLVLIALTFGTASGQQTKLTKARLFKIFETSVQQESKESVMVGYNDWITCNKDSAFFKNDTIRLYENILYKDSEICCEMVGWTFWKRDSFVIQEKQTCKEPSSAKVSKDGKDFFTIKIEKKEEKLYLSTFSIYDGNRLVDTFLVRSLDEEKRGKKLGKVLTLVRIK